MREFFLGWIEGVRISRGVRYREDFRPSDRPVTDDATTALFLFEEGEGNELKDSSGNSHHGTIRGARWVRVADPPLSTSPDRPFSTHPLDAMDREVLAWALGLGGKARVIVGDGRVVAVDTPDDMPAETFQLIDLNLRENPRLTDEAAVKIGRARRLQSLDAEFTAFGDRGLTALRALPLETLQLRSTKVTSKGLAALVGCHSLRTLVLMDTPVDDEGLAHLAGLPQLQTLWLHHTKITDAGLKHLVGLPRLENLFLQQGDYEAGKNITDAIVFELARMPTLRRLTLHRTAVTDAGVRALNPGNRFLELQFAGTAITDAGVAHVAQFDSLEGLSLADTRVSDASVPALSGLTNLRSLLVDGTRISGTGLRQLADSLPNCNVQPRPPVISR